MDLSQYTFSCPHCNEPLSYQGVVTLNTVRENGEKGTIRLAASVGNYSYEHEPRVEFIDGEVVDFLCPKCNTTLETDQYEDFALLKMKVDKNIEFEVIFSRKAGKRKTYVITEDGIDSYQG